MRSERIMQPSLRGSFHSCLCSSTLIWSFSCLGSTSLSSIVSYAQLQEEIFFSFVTITLTDLQFEICSALSSPASSYSEEDLWDPAYNADVSLASESVQHVSICQIATMHTMKDRFLAILTQAYQFVCLCLALGIPSFLIVSILLEVFPHQVLSTVSLPHSPILIFLFRKHF